MSLETIVISILGSIGTIFTGLIVWGLKSLIGAVIKNTNEMAVLSSKIETIMKNADKIPELEKDINSFHAWKREVITKGKNNENQ